MKDLPRPKKTKVKKVKLSDLMGSGGKANADLYKDDEKKREFHLKNRSIRENLITPKGGEYRRRLSGDAALDIKYYELAREFINNGMNQSKAYAAVFGVSPIEASRRADKVFNSSWIRALLVEMMCGTDGKISELPKEYYLTKLQQQIESNILDYVDNDGVFLSVRELKTMPLFAQQIIKKLNVNSWSVPNMVRVDGVMEEHGEIRHQRIQIELYDKQKALEQLAKAMKWITSHTEIINQYINADIMVAANRRVKELRRSTDIEGQAKRITAD